MDSGRKLIARKMFRLRVHEAKGTEYQRLFEKVMGYREKGFVPIKPHGNLGDRKNDGYVPRSGTYFQVYAPEDPDGRRIAVRAAEKALEDFQGLLAHWDRDTPIRTFRFVFNDSYRGSPPQVEAAMAAIRNDHEVEAAVFLAKDLEDEALQLAEDQLIDVVNTPIPEPDVLPSVDFTILREVIRYVLDSKVLVSAAAYLTAPDFDEKILFNGLTKGVAGLLTVGSYQTEAVTDFFSKNSTFARQHLRDHLAQIYADSRERLSADGVAAEDLGDLVFFDLLLQITPCQPSWSLKQQSAAQEAGIVVMAYYFEACDIFEDPNASPG